MSTRSRRLLAALMVAAAAAAAVALPGCDSSGSDADAQELLRNAFKRPLKSADVKLEAQIKVEGLPGFDRPIRIQATGPYKENKATLPSFDLNLSIGVAGAPAIETGRISTGDRAFVKFEDNFYEVDPKEVRASNEAFRKGRKRGRSNPALTINPRPWVAEAKTEGDEKVGGTETTHVSGRLEVGRMVRDLNELVRKNSSLLSSAASPVPRPLRKSEIKQLESVIEDPTFDIYVAKEDDSVRRLSGSVRLEVPEADRSQVGGISGGSISFSIEFTDVNGDQDIEVPENARPISELSSQLRGLATGGLSGEAGGGTTEGGGSGTESERETGTGTETAPQSGGIQGYSECLERTSPEDTEGLEKCAELLN